MKISLIPQTLLTLSALLVTQGSLALSSSQVRSLEQANQLILEFNDLDLQHIYVELDFKNEENIHVYPQFHCRNSRNFTKSSSSVLAHHLTSVLKDLQERAADQLGEADAESDSYIEFEKKMHKMQRSVSMTFKNSKILKCVEYSVPAYSDGHEQTFYKVDGNLSVALTVGSPD